MDPLISDPENMEGLNYSVQTKRPASVVSWGAIVAGAVGAAALSIILLMLGVGLGLSSVSPWSGEGISAATFGISTIVWLTFTQLLASGMGGYLAGRLRTRWASTSNDEVYFRDTAHGFLAWAVASLATAALLSSAVAGIVGGVAKAGATGATAVASSAAAGAVGSAGSVASGAKGEMPAAGNGPMDYAVDALFRASPSTSTTSASSGIGGSVVASPVEGQVPFSRSLGMSASTAEVGRIFEHSLLTGELSGDDARYVGQLIAQRTGIPQAEAEKRVAEGYQRLTSSLRATEARAKQTADEARKATSYATLWIFISLLIGAFIASFCATFGGRQRDAAPLPL